MTTTSHALESGGRRRRYLVHAPSALAAGRVPAMVVLHGAGGTAEWTLEETDWDKTADREEFLLIVPEGTRADTSRPAGFLDNPQDWNSGGGRGLLAASGADDVGFIRDVLDRVEGQYPIDPRRVYLTGFSNGAAMTFRLGAELSERFAALAPVAGPLRIQDPRPTVARPTVYLIGSADPLMPLEGGTVASPWGGRTFLRAPLTETLRRWAVALGCPPNPVPRSGPEGVIVTEYGPGRDGSSLLVYVIDGLGHHWPGGLGRLKRRFAGQPSNRLRANDVIWDFFHRHPG
jgi:polyhydroxybutyrate depolymerase